MNRIVCWFSCGAASAVATKLTLRNYPAEQIVIARCIVKEEHEDNNRFAADCEKWFNHPILNLMDIKHGGSIYEVFRARNYISGVLGAPCTMILKKGVRESFEVPTDKHIFGYTNNKKDLERWDNFIDANNIECEAPLIDRGITHSECLSIVQSAGIKLPEMYLLGYQHNNCIGCVKSSGKGYWNKIRIDFPDSFERMVSESRRLGVKIIKDGKKRIFLDELMPGTGNYQEEEEIQCGPFCEMAKKEINF